MKATCDLPARNLAAHPQCGPTRIICLGNRFAEADSAGPQVLDLLRQMQLSPSVETVEGGLAGLDLLPLLEGARRVIFVDAITGFDQDGVSLLTGAEVAELAGSHYEHAAGLPYLLKVLPQALEGPAPFISLVGIQGVADPARLRQAAELAVRLAAANGALP